MKKQKKKPTFFTTGFWIYLIMAILVILLVIFIIWDNSKIIYIR